MQLNFMGMTKCTKIDVDEIPSHHFDFLGFYEILVATKDDKMIGNLY